MIYAMEISEIKQRLSIETVLSHYNLKPDRHNFLKCPFHDDQEPSLKIYPETNTFNCFGCGAAGDVIEFIERYEKKGKHEAILKAQGLTGVEPAIKLPPFPEEPAQLPKERTEILTRIFESFKHGLRHPVSVKPKEYLQKRNLDSAKLEAGYNSGQFHHHGKLSEADQRACIKAGLLIPYGGSVPNGSVTYTPFAKECIIFPLKDQGGNIVSLYGRSILESRNGTGKHFYLRNRTGLYPGYPKPETEKLILSEAIIDAATLLQIPEITKNYTILACYGTNGLTDEHKSAIKDLQRLKEIIFFFDGDNAGKEGIKHGAGTLQELLPEVKISYIETPEGEDINSLSVTYGSDIFTTLLSERKLFLLNEDLLTENTSVETFSDKPALAEASAGRKEKEVEPGPEPAISTGKLDTRNPVFITYTTGDPAEAGQALQIVILGGINLQQLDRLRVTIKISRKDKPDPLHSVRHTLDLYHSDYLEKFLIKASEQLEIGTSDLRRAIAELTEQVEAYRLSRVESMKEQKPKARELSEERRERAIRYLKSPNLLERTNEDIGKTGVVGEEINRLLMYLVFTSRLREQPLHIVSLGASGTGKTYLQEKISELIPEQDKLEITILSENAFYYFDRRELRHKLVLIEDMDGVQEVLYPLRELQTKRKISKTIPIKDSKGNLRTITLHVEGPICLAGTTTMERLYEDNANRSLLIYVDGSSGHKELVMDYQRRLSAGRVNVKEEDRLKEAFKDMQSVLAPIAVRNPFAEMLRLPEHVFKPLRTNSHYLAFIETVTFYHQYQREVKTDPVTGERFIETTIGDIEWANRLLRDVLLSKSDELSGECRSLFERLKKWVKAEGKGSFFAGEVRGAFRMNPSNLKYYLIQLVRYGYIKPVGGDRYKRGYEYEIISFDEYKNLNSGISSVFDEVLEEIKNKLGGQRG
jgi:DNA primase catalytic core